MLTAVLAHEVRWPDSGAIAVAPADRDRKRGRAAAAISGNVTRPPALTGHVVAALARDSDVMRHSGCALALTELATTARAQTKILTHVRHSPNACEDFGGPVPPLMYASDLALLPDQFKEPALRLCRSFVPRPTRHHEPFRSGFATTARNRLSSSGRTAQSCISSTTLS
jgi:hypothetical protein